jgi:signal transduction histidine kinase
MGSERSTSVERLSRPFWALLAVSFGGLVALAAILTVLQDRDTLERSERMVSTVLETRAARMGDLALEYGYWDSAVEHVVDSLDSRWIVNNMAGPYLSETLGVEELLVVDGAGAPVLTVVGGEIVDAPQALTQAQGLDALIAQARQRGPTDDVDLSAAAGLIRAADGFYQAGAVLMTSYGTVDGEEVDLPSDHVLVFADAIDAAALQALSEGYLLPRLRISDDPPAFTEASVPVRTADGAAHGWFVWAPQLSGLGKLPFLIAGIAAAFAVMLITARTFMTRINAVGRELEAARNDAQRANAAKTDFLRNVAHEVRTPVNAMVGFATMMKDELFGPLGNDRYKEYAVDIVGAGGHVLDLVGDLLDLERIEAGQMEYDFADVNVAAAVDECITFVKPSAEEKGVAVNAATTGEPETMRTDPRVFRQMLLNLLSNAIKFTPAGGAVTCTVAASANGGIVVSVSDTGKGMTADQIPRVLEPFHQIRGASAGGGTRGSGLGLPITKRLTEDLGGAFHLESAPDKGTTAIIELPQRAA